LYTPIAIACSNLYNILLKTVRITGNLNKYYYINKVYSIFKNILMTMSCTYYCRATTRVPKLPLQQILQVLYQKITLSKFTERN